MKIDFDVILRDIEGNAMKERIVGTGEVRESPVTLGRVAANALLAFSDDDKNMAGEDKVKKYDLAMRVIKGEASLKAEEIADIKAAIGKHYAPLVVGQAWRMLDPSE